MLDDQSQSKANKAAPRVVADNDANFVTPPTGFPNERKGGATAESPDFSQQSTQSLEQPFAQQVHKRERLKEVVYRELMRNDSFECLYNKNLRGTQNINIAPHHHAFFEFLFIIEGSLSYVVEGRNYDLKAGDIVLIDALQFHSGTVNLQHQYLRYLLWIHPHYIQRLQERYPDVDLLSSFKLNAYHHNNLIRLPAELFLEIKATLSRLYVSSQYSDPLHRTLAECYLTSILVHLIQYIPKFDSQNVAALPTTSALASATAARAQQAQASIADAMLSCESQLRPQTMPPEIESLPVLSSFSEPHGSEPHGVETHGGQLSSVDTITLLNPKTPIASEPEVGAIQSGHVVGSEGQGVHGDVVVQQAMDFYPLPYDAGKKGADQMLVALMHFINTHLAEDLSLGELAQRFGVSKFHLTRKFKELTGFSLHQYIVKKRLLHAKYLISLGSEPYQAALDAGFNNYSNFSRSFTAYFGENPASCSRRLQKQEQSKPYTPTEQELNQKKPTHPVFS